MQRQIAKMGLSDRRPGKYRPNRLGRNLLILANRVRGYVSWLCENSCLCQC